MLNIDEFIKDFNKRFAEQRNLLPWEITAGISDILIDIIKKPDTGYRTENGIAIHDTAIIEKGVILKAPIIIGKNCFIGANSYIRGGVYLADSVCIGPNCEIKTSIIFSNCSIGHLNFIGDSIIGNNVNFEAGAITANHYNEREEKDISVVYNSEIINTHSKKFGSLVGDNSRIGANAVLSPGTILLKRTVVKRLELINQTKEKK
jgi:UDP-N-acetylglucosamine diphosphorylase / glucose-1-phosphate thymidylyltransferase / UDP-N-acetylgalactosamine diphosphorylase / glucosamine-1-phosphate N-acetyltransferase / galactosamine-1-phosphate N-acetyltransferase